MGRERDLLMGGNGANGHAEVSRGTLKLADARALTPAPSGIGAWAERLRMAAFDAVKESDVREIMEGLIAKAKAGDLKAANMVLGYLTGGGAPKVQQVVMVQAGTSARRHNDEED